MRTSLLNVAFSLVNISPFLKRVFFFDPSIYGVISIAPLLALFPLGISVGRVLVATLVTILSLLVFFFKGWFDFVMLAPFILAISYHYYQRVSFDDFLSKLVPLFVIVVAYSIYQKLFGYTAFEMGWILSGLGTVVAEGYFITSDIRPFSLLAGTPELAFFISVFSFYFFTKKRWFIFVIALFVLLIVGSRGVMVGFVIATSVTLLNKYMRFGYRVSLIVSLLLSSIVYLFLIYIYPIMVAPYITSLFNDGRLVVYGTFNARLLNLLELVDNIDSLFVGAKYKASVADNFFLYLVYNYGLGSLIIFLGFIFYYTNSRKNLFLSSILLAYMFYADVFLSYFMTYNYCIWMFLNEKNSDSI